MNRYLTDRPSGGGGGGMRLLSLAMGVFLVCMGIGKLDWLTDSGLLTAELQGWWGSAPAVSRWYIDNLAIPGAPVFARLVPFGELTAGAALLAGCRVRLAAGVALLMILNFHFTMGILFQTAYLTNGYGLPVVGALGALALAPKRMPFCIEW